MGMESINSFIMSKVQINQRLTLSFSSSTSSQATSSKWQIFDLTQISQGDAFEDDDADDQLQDECLRFQDES